LCLRLNSNNVEKQQKIYGWNELKKELGKLMWKLVLKQFDDLLVKILLVIVFVSLVMAYINCHMSGEIFLEQVCEPML
jgi:Ca2+-transporting ATPase